MPEHRPQQRIDIPIRLLLDAGQQPGRPHEVDQVRSGNRGDLQAVAMGELAQELAQRGRRVHLVEQSRILPVRMVFRSSMLSAPAAMPATIAASLPAGFAPAEATAVSVKVTLSETSSQAGPFGQGHHGDQARARHDVVLVEQWGGLGPGVG